MDKRASPLFAIESSGRIKLSGLTRLVEHQDEFQWQPFLEGVEVHRLYGDGVSGPTATLIRFCKAAVIPLHEHVGFEHLYILAGNQSDEQGVLGAGDFVINMPGTRHRVVGEAGCLVLAIYEKPVMFLETQ